MSMVGVETLLFVNQNNMPVNAPKELTVPKEGSLSTKKYEKHFQIGVRYAYVKNSLESKGEWYILPGSFMENMILK